MFVKRYIANDLSEAMEKIRKELGSDAVILSHRSIRKSVFSKKLVEVMVAYEPAPDRKLKVENEPIQTVTTHNSDLHIEEMESIKKGSEQPGAGVSRATPAMLSAEEETKSSISKGQRYPEESMRGVMQYQQVAVHARYGQPIDETRQPIAYQPEVLQAASRDSFAPAFAPATPQPYPPRQPAWEASLPKNSGTGEKGHEEPDYDWQTTLRRVSMDPEPSQNRFNGNQIFGTQDSQKKSGSLRESEAKIEELNTKLNELRGVVKSLTAKIITVDKENLLRFSSGVMRIYNTMVEQDVHEDFARGICERVQEEYEKTKAPPESLARQIVLRMLNGPAPFLAKRGKKSIVMLIGPTGVGKTTTLVKLAGSYILSEGLRVGFINSDTYRVAAQEQLKVYADIMEIPCCTVYTPEEIPLALHTLSDCDLILIDTAGKSMGDSVYHEELRAFIEASGGDDVEILLHVSAAMSHHACSELIYNFSYLKKYRLIITKLDEITAWGNILNICAFAKQPVAFVTMGQNVPQDIEVPNMRHIADKILESEGL